MRTFKHGIIRKISNEPYLEQPRFKIGSTRESFSFSELLNELVMLRMLEHVAEKIYLDAAEMLGKASTADKIIKYYCNGLGGLVVEFDNFIYHIARDYGLRYGDTFKAADQATKIVEQAVFEAKKEAEKMLRIEEKVDERT